MPNSKPEEKLVASFKEYIKEDHAGEDSPKVDGNLEDEAVELDLDVALLDELVEIIGDEEAVENAAKLAYEDLVQKSREEVELGEGKSPESLAIASLIVKLKELDKIDAEAADEFLAKHIK